MLDLRALFPICRFDSVPYTIRVSNDSVSPAGGGANRDEFYARPSRAARYWDDSPHVFGGRDVVAGGTWLAVSTAGRFAAVTNYTDFIREEVPPASRGDLTRRFLEEGAGARDYAAGIDGARYQGFNLIAFDGVDLVYACNRTGETRVLDPASMGSATRTWTMCGQSPRAASPR